MKPLRASYIFVVVFVIFVAGAGPAFGQSTGTVAGRASNAETGRPLPGVNVVAKGTERGASTGPEGQFTIDGLAPGTYTIQARFVGYAPRSVEVDVSAGETTRVRLALSPTTVGLDAVEVTASSKTTEASEKIQKADIQEANARTSGELMQTMSGVNVVRRGPVGLDPVVRGLRETQVGVYVDGMRTFPAGPARMDSPLSHTGPSTLQSVEVAKGPYALTWGGGQLSAIRAETNDLFGVPRGERLTGEVETGYDSNFDSYDVTGTASGRSGAAAYRIDGAYRRGHDYESGDGRTVPADFLNRELRAKVGYNLDDDQRLTAGGGYQQQDDVNYPGRLLKADLFRSGRARLGYEYTSGQGLVRSVKATAYGYQTLHTMDNREKPTFEAGGIKPGVPPNPLRISVTSDVTTFGGRLATKLVPSPTLRVMVGADGYRAYRDAERPFKVVMNGEPRVPGFYESDQIWPGVSIADAGVFTQVTRLLGDVEATGTVRADVVWAGADEDQVTDVYLDVAEPGPGSIDAGALDQQEFNVSGALMLTAPLSQAWSLSVGGGTAVRTADALERFSDRFPATKSQTSAEFIGNPRLDPERSWQGDVELEARYDRASFRVSGFARHLSNYITLETAPDVDPMLPLPIFKKKGPFRYANGTATFYGGETSASVAVLPSLTARLSGSYLWGKNGETDQPALGVAPLQGDLTLRWEPPARRFHVESTLHATAGQDRAASVLGETETDGYATWDLQGGVELGHGVSLGAGVANLTDTDYVNHLNAKNPYSGAPISEPGRVFTTTLTVDF